MFDETDNFVNFLQLQVFGIAGYIQGDIDPERLHCAIKKVAGSGHIVHLSALGKQKAKARLEPL